MKRTTTIGKKLTFNFLAMLGLVVALSLVSLDVVRSLGHDLDYAVNSTAKKMELVGSLKAGFHDLNVQTTATHLNYVIRELSGGRAHESVAGTPCSTCHDSSGVGNIRRKFESDAAAAKRQVAALRELTAPGDRKSLDALEAAVDRWSAYYREYLQQADAGHFGNAHEIVTEKMYPLLAEILKTTQAMTEQEQHALEVSDQNAIRSVARNRWFILLAMVLGLGISAGVFLAVRGISRALRELAIQLGVGAEEVAGAAGHISSASQALAQGASEQAGSLEETASFGDQVKSSAQANAEDAKKAAELAAQVRQEVVQANATLNRMLAAMQQIDDSSREISKIIQVIQEIAFQTNILALNAAVEAARAGESGMGFAVVADEVRNLARRCSEAARETTTLIEQSLANTNNGKTHLAEVAGSVRSMTESSEQARALMEKVQNGNQEQARETIRIARAIAEMEKVTQSSAASAEQSASASEQLNAQSESLKEIVHKLSTLVGT